jgi:hypothetical protein
MHRTGPAILIVELFDAGRRHKRNGGRAMTPQLYSRAVTVPLAVHVYSLTSIGIGTLRGVS